MSTCKFVGVLEACAWMLGGTMVGALVVGALWAAYALRIRRRVACTHSSTIGIGTKWRCAACGVDL